MKQKIIITFIFLAIISSLCCETQSNGYYPMYKKEFNAKRLVIDKLFSNQANFLVAEFKGCKNITAERSLYGKVKIFAQEFYNDYKNQGDFDIVIVKLIGSIEPGDDLDVDTNIGEFKFEYEVGRDLDK